ncbi:putative ER lumen protein retaining receptor [Medicago truncatula]|uniref:Putative ER lumen protein retaining receptor n=1 Tax=Medicago truncatula TaxID=3880 RepID=A0A396GFL3_MEDTR|nr:putative ER lumen protein retaining receptor [Medicago truncatula]
MKNAKMVETFTGYYVFALGVSRFFTLAFWIIHMNNHWFANKGLREVVEGEWARG